MAGILGVLPPGLQGYVASEQMANQRGQQAFDQAKGILAMQQASQLHPLKRQMMQLELDQARNPVPLMKDLGDRFGAVDPRTGQMLYEIPKSATPDAVLRNRGEMERHAVPSGSAQMGSQTSIRGQDIGAQTARRGQDVTMRGQDLQEGREQFGAPIEVTGPEGRPVLAVQRRRTGELLDANTQQPVGAAGPKVGESAQKQQTGVASTKNAITEYRDTLKNWKMTDALDPRERAKMGVVYNNMLLQAKEAYNLGVLNGPDYMILQQVITNPASWMGTVTSNKALDDQAVKLDEIMTRIGQQVVTTQSGKMPNNRQNQQGWGIRPLP